MSGATIVLGVMGCLILASGFIFIGMRYIAPMLSPYPTQAPPTEQSTEVAPKPLVPKTDNITSRDTTGSGALDIQIIEETAKQQSALNAAETGVKQDNNNITVTLDPKQSASDAGTGATDQSAVKDRKEPQPAAADAVTDSSPKMRYHVQAGTFANMVNAENLATELRNKGYKPQINSVGREAGTLYRVELGDYKTRQGAEDLAAELSSKGYNPTVTSKRGN